MTLVCRGVDGFESRADRAGAADLPGPYTGDIRLPERDGQRPRGSRPLLTSREYTVRRHDPDAREIDVDVMLHPGGLASDWAERVAPGERVHLAGPPGGLVVPDTCDRYLLGRV